MKITQKLVYSNNLLYLCTRKGVPLTTKGIKKYIIRTKQ